MRVTRVCLLTATIWAVGCAPAGLSGRDLSTAREPELEGGTELESPSVTAARDPSRPAFGTVIASTTTARRTQELEPVVASVKFALEGPNVPATLAIEVQRSQFLDGKAVVHFSDLLPGPVEVSAEAFSQAKIRLGTALATGSVVAGETTLVTFNLVPATGTVAVAVDGPFVPKPAARIGSLSGGSR